MMKYFAYGVIVFTCIVLLNCREKSEKPAEQLPEYTEVLRNIEEKRQGLATRYRQAHSELQRTEAVEEAREVLFNVIRDDLLPQWFGTSWDFNGTTETPRQGKIACGYFVTTILRDAGFKVQRARLAQQASELIIKSLTNEAHIKRFSNASINDSVEAIQEWGQGFYLVGLDIHTGFIINDAKGVSFVHSSYLKPRVVLKETARESPILSSSNYRVLGKLSADDGLVVKWLLEQAITTKTR
jgi:hypothetical protein